MNDKGFIQEKNIKTGTTNGKDWTLLLFKINDETYATFDDKFNGFNKGDEVVFDWEKKKDKLNIVTMILAKDEGNLLDIAKVGKKIIDEADDLKRIAAALERIATSMEKGK